jgi:hypothetical protein
MEWFMMLVLDCGMLLSVELEVGVFRSSWFKG